MANLHLKKEYEEFKDTEAILSTIISDDMLIRESMGKHLSFTSFICLFHFSGIKYEHGEKENNKDNIALNNILDQAHGSLEGAFSSSVSLYASLLQDKMDVLSWNPTTKAS